MSTISQFGNNPAGSAADLNSLDTENNGVATSNKGQNILNQAGAAQTGNNQNTINQTGNNTSQSSLNSSFSGLGQVQQNSADANASQTVSDQANLALEAETQAADLESSRHAGVSAALGSIAKQ